MLSGTFEKPAPDGGKPALPQQLIHPGERWRPVLKIDQPAATQSGFPKHTRIVPSIQHP
jgi:hypothetical protein